MGWFYWIVIICIVGVIQAEKGEVMAGVFALGVLGYSGYTNTLKILSRIEHALKKDRE